MTTTKPRDIIDRLERTKRSLENTETARGTPEHAHSAIASIDEVIRMVEGMEDPYAERVKRFHDEVREAGDEDYLTVLADRLGQDNLPVPPDTPHEAVDYIAEIKAERNRLFWAAFLSEENGEVSSCLTSGDPPEDFREEVADVLVLCHAIADVFGFDMLEAFHEVMDENDEKPKRQEGTGKLPAEARGRWGEQ